jgi:hypothetical protein
MQGGILVNGRNAKSKKAVKEALAADPNSVRFYDTSMMNNGGSFLAPELPAGVHVFVGPDPYTARSFYGNISVKNGVVKVS